MLVVKHIHIFKHLKFVKHLIPCLFCKDAPMPNLMLMKLHAHWPLLIRFCKIFEMSTSKEKCMIPVPCSGASVTLSTDHLSQLMTTIAASQSVVDAKLQQFHENICQGQEEAATHKHSGQTPPLIELKAVD